MSKKVYINCEICNQKILFKGMQQCYNCWMITSRIPHFVSFAKTEYLEKLRDTINKELKQREE